MLRFTSVRCTIAQDDFIIFSRHCIRPRYRLAAENTHHYAKCRTENIPKQLHFLLLIGYLTTVLSVCEWDVWVRHTLEIWCNKYWSNQLMCPNLIRKVVMVIMTRKVLYKYINAGLLIVIILFCMIRQMSYRMKGGHFISKRSRVTLCGIIMFCSNTLPAVVSHNSGTEGVIVTTLPDMWQRRRPMSLCGWDLLHLRVLACYQSSCINPQ